jgi:hypothetical protein
MSSLYLLLGLLACGVVLLNPIHSVFGVSNTPLALTSLYITSAFGAALTVPPELLHQVRWGQSLPRTAAWPLY